MRRYETIYILRPTMSEDEVTAVIDNTNTILGADGGQMISLDKWGLRTLAYEIKKETQGYYVFSDYASDPANVTEMERKFRIDDSIMKYLTIKLADSIDEDGIAVARGEYEAAVVAAAKAAEETSSQEEEQTEKSPKDAKVATTEATANDVKVATTEATANDVKVAATETTA